jgi:hypothetical protein
MAPQKNCIARVLEFWYSSTMSQTPHPRTLLRLFFVTLAILIGVGIFTASAEAQSLPFRLEGLPVGKVEVFKSRKNEGTVILVPQSHQAPGSKPQEKINDQPFETQKEIYAILKKLTNESDVDTILVEGFMKNASTDEKTKSVSRAESERKMFLAGAAFVLKNENKNVDVVGVEEKELHDKGAQIIREYVIQQEQGKVKKETKKKIQEVIIEKRNKVVAQNTKNLLTEKNISAGILVFGAGHTEGLISELKSQGLNVIVVTPESIVK